MCCLLFSADGSLVGVLFFSAPAVILGGLFDLFYYFSVAFSFFGWKSRLTWGFVNRRTIFSL